MNENEADEQGPGDERGLSQKVALTVLVLLLPFFYSDTYARTIRTLGEGVSCAAVLLVRLPPPLPTLHPGVIIASDKNRKRGGYKYST